jgi:hypothetical protein
VLFYDADSSLGTDNKGNLTFDYYLEDIDYTEGGDPVYNGQNSVLWKNLRATRYDKIMEMYQGFRTNKQISYDSVIGRFEAHQSKWPEAIFNEDMHRKCIEPLEVSGDGTYLPMLQGKKEMWMKWWLYNRFRYLDSKYCTGTSMENRITLRTHAMANITIASYVNMYGHVFYNAEQVEHRMVRGQEYEFVSQATGAEDRVIGINDADMLTTLGDLSPHMVELIDVSKATHITDLKIGDGAEGYANYSLNNITLGNNRLLRTLDVRNCPNLAQSVDISGCTNIEEVYFDGTSITGLTLPNGGILKKLHLPGTITNLTIRNQPSLTEFVLPSYSSITTLRLENAGVVDSLEILADIPSNSRVRIIGFTYNAETFEDFVWVLNKLDTMRGLDENGNNVDKAQVSGKVHIGTIFVSQLKRIQRDYPSITVTYDTLEANIITKLVERTMTGAYKNSRVTVAYTNKLSHNTYITSLDLPKLTKICSDAFTYAGRVTAVILRNTDAVCTLVNTNAFTAVGTFSELGTFYIYVPKTMADGSDGVAAYQAATNWSNFASQIRAIEDWPEICGGA